MGDIFLFLLSFCNLHHIMIALDDVVSYCRFHLKELYKESEIRNRKCYEEVCILFSG